MKPNGHSDDNLPNGVGAELGHEAFEHAQVQGNDYCQHERGRIEILNEPTILALRARIALRQDEAKELEERIRNAPPEGDVQARRKRARLYYAIAGLLLIGVFVFTLITLEPFQMGWIGWILALAFAVVTPFLCDLTLDVWEVNRYQLWHKILVTGVCFTAVGGQLLLGVVRGYVFREQLTNKTATVVIEGESLSDTAPTFYDKATGCLMLALPLLSLALEFGAALAIRQARKWGAESEEDRDELRGKLYAVREEQIELAHESKLLEARGQEFEHRFLRDFDRTMFNRSRAGMLSILAAAFFLGLHPNIAVATDRLNLVMAVDLSGSVAAAQGQDGKSDLQRNLAAVSSVLAYAPAGSKISVIGITDKSFSSPYILLAGMIDSNEGYFKERIKAAREQLVASWKRRCSSLPAPSQRTDVLGALVISSHLLQPIPGWRNVLVLFSDMRDTRAVNLNEASKVPATAALKRVIKQELIADLKKVEVYVLGVGGAEKEPAYWNSLRQFWAEYFKKSGATLRTYSMLRKSPDFLR